VRVVEVVAFFAFLGGAGLFGRAALRSLGAGRERQERWEPYHRAEGDGRRVYVRRGTELEPVGAVASDDPDYEDRFLRLMDRARERASTLNSEP
jgi:hypothetical protein